jgi:UDP-2,3-diacylglucosamine pyrophosphatase LpxH
MNDPCRPPLADQLFENRDAFTQVLDRFPVCKPIIPSLRIRPDKDSVEERLQTLQDEADQDPNRVKQLAGIRYYLQSILWWCDESWQNVVHGITNHLELLDTIRHYSKPGETTYLVTFNYDRLIESALSANGLQIRHLPDYITNEKWKLIKLHGSINWVREIDNESGGFAQGSEDVVANALIDKAADLAISQRYRIVNHHPSSFEGDILLFPAFTIPLQSKSHFECPPEHIRVLEEALPQIDKLLLIGWRATERPFVNLLAKGLSNRTRTMIVAGTQDDVRQTSNNLHRECGEKVQYAGELEIGFSQLIVKRSVSSFLRG